MLTTVYCLLIMTTPQSKANAEVSLAFIATARELITQEYLPKIERCLERLSDEQVWWRPNSDSNSIGNLLLHICGNARQWIVCGLGEAPDKRQRQSEFDERGPIPRVELLDKLSTTIAEVDQTIANVSANELLTEYSIQGAKATGLAAIFHVTEHISMHTGQIITLTKMLANVDLVFYDFSTGKPVHTWHVPKS
ncbi:MAG TPA: DinB family protein [Pyrinomonadaceae bacterium]|nr:DinB family protein [Pyrinomonadaceae bacterium]